MNDALTERIRESMAGDLGAPLADERFDELARQVFAAQFAGCGRYRAYCEGRQVTPENLAHWSEIPAAPVRAFQEVLLWTDSDPPARVFETSGTTSRRRGRHALSEPALDLYRSSLRPNFRRHLLPELASQAAGTRSALLPLCLAPASADAPSSSLFFMFDDVLESFFREPPRRVFGPHGLDGTAWRAALVEAEREGRPVCLLGTALALHAACAWLEARRERFYLPAESRALQTGGTKGSGLAFTPRALRQRLADTLGLDPDFVVAEYGMTEAASQFYERELLDAWARDASCAPAERSDGETRRLHGPPWVRAVVCDVETLRPAPAGSTGVVRLVDLANRFTLSFLQTEDLAVAEVGTAGAGSGPFALLGRATGAEARGCSLTTEEWMRRAAEATS